MTLAPSSFALTTFAKAIGCASAMLLPMIKIASLFTRSCGKVVAPPRPNDVPRPGTVELCHIRAWLLTQTMPNPPVKSFLPEDWAWFASATRPEYDTAPRCPVWAHHSVAVEQQ